MCFLLRQSEMSKSNGNSALSPELKSWIDGVIVPALVREYLAGREREKSACSEGEPVTQCAPTRTAIAEEGK